MSLLQLAALEFPPKKLFGNRDERMVAERRNHLEVTRFVPVRFTFNEDSGCVAVEAEVDLFYFLLQRYLRNLFRVMLSSSSSPLRADADGHFHLTKHDICEFCPFFKKGVFEYSSHGTGWLERECVQVGMLHPAPFSKPKNLVPFSLRTAVRESPGRSERKWQGGFLTAVQCTKVLFQGFFPLIITASHRDILTRPRTIYKVKGRLTVLKSVMRNQIRTINKFYSHYILCNVRVQYLLPGFKTSHFFFGTTAFNLLESWSDSVIWW